MANTNIINAVFGSGLCAVTTSAYRANYGMKLRFSGIDLPTAFEADFSNYDVMGRDSITMIGQNCEVQIPDDLWDSGLNIYAYVYLHPTDNSGVTVYTVTIPVLGRPNRTEEEPTPHEQSVIEQAISALNDAVEQTAADVVAADTSASAAAESATNAQESAEQAEQSAQSIEGDVERAERAAATATEKATEAASSASTASSKASEASASATAAAQSASSASVSAQNAAESEQLAESHATDAEQAKTDAQAAQAAAEQAAQSVSGLSAQIAQNTADIADLVLSKAGALVDTASGSIASFYTDATIPTVKGLTVNVEPVQDLNGYDNPWPAGGGKNLLQVTAVDDKITHSGLTLTTNPDGTIRVTGTSTGGNFNFGTATLPAGTYTFSHGTNLDGLYLNIAGVSNSSRTGSNFTLSEAQTVTVRCFPSASGTVVNGYLEPMIRLSTSASDYAPYSNICPISGWDEVDVWDDPKYGGTVAWNQLANFAILPSAANGITYSSSDGKSVTFNGTATRLESRTGWFGISETQLASRVGHKIALIPRIISGSVSNGSIRYVLFNSSIKEFNKPIISVVGTTPTTQRIATNITNGTVANNYTVSFVCFDLTAMFGSTIADYIYNLEQTNEGAGVAYFRNLFQKDYYPFDDSYTETCVSAVNGDPYLKYTIHLGQTVYGGTVDVTNGVLTVDRAMVDLGTLTWSTYGATSDYDRYITSGIDSLAKANRDCLCSMFACKAVAQDAVANTVWVGGGSAKLSVTTSKGAYSNASAFKTAMSGVQLVYELATPITISLTPIEISVLTGQTNNIWADCGDVSVEYAADLKTYIDNKIAAAVAALS